jgi:hypothetical protein
VNKIILRALNAPGILILAAIGVALQSSLFSSGFLNYFQPDTALLLVIWVALRRSFLEGGILTLLIADIVELHSAAPQGFFLILYMLVYLTVRGAARVLVISGLSSVVYLTMLLSIGQKLAGGGLLELLGTQGKQWNQTFWLMLPFAAVQGVLSLWAYNWLDRFDLATFKHPKVDRETDLDEDALQFEGEVR